MRNPLSNPDVHLMQYAIREIVDTANSLKKMDPTFELTWENIGDPIAKSWPVPHFLKDLIKQEVDLPDDKVFGYTHSRGNPKTREWVTQYAKKFSPTSNLSADDILFTSGLGAAVSAIYEMTEKNSRILQPSPSYPAHSSMESFFSKADPMMYKLDPENEWQPDLADMESQIKAHPEITGILVINPNNPTGGVYSKETLEKIVQLAEDNNLMLISDEVYFRMTFNKHTHTQITDIAHNRVPLVVMRGLSKDVPWPGGRCGWLEFHNSHLDPEFQKYAEGVKKRILMEVCSVSLPQAILPKLYDHPDFKAWNENYNRELQDTANMISDILSEIPEMLVNRTNGAFYMMPLFREGVLNNKQTLPIANDQIRAFIENEIADPKTPLDKRFCMYLLGSTGIVVVPASGFFSPYSGFRITTLERDPEKRKSTYGKVADAIRTYIASA